MDRSPGAVLDLAELGGLAAAAKRKTTTRSDPKRARRRFALGPPE